MCKTGSRYLPAFTLWKPVSERLPTVCVAFHDGEESSAACVHRFLFPSWGNWCWNVRNVASSFRGVLPKSIKDIWVVFPFPKWTPIFWRRPSSRQAVHLPYRGDRGTCARNYSRWPTSDNQRGCRGCWNSIRNMPENSDWRFANETWRSSKWILHHDNAPAHRAVATSEFLAKHNIPSLPHPPYSPDLAPCDFFLFPQLKKTMKGRRFDDIEGVQANATRQMRDITKSGYQRCFRLWQERWNKCIQAQGHYFEGDKSN